MRKTKHVKRDKLWAIIMVAAFCILAILESYIPSSSVAAASGDKGESQCEFESGKKTNGPYETQGLSPKDNQYEGILRFHVKANSDSDEDQNLKMMVKNNVFSKIQNGIANEISYQLSQVPAKRNDDEEAQLREEITRRYVCNNLDNIKKWAADCVKAAGCDYDVGVKVGVTSIPAKDYDGIYFPPGNYEALTITIGEGKGQNWWCVIFPPLCLIDCENSQFKEESQVYGEDRIVLKSKIAELLKKEKTDENEDLMLKKIKEAGFIFGKEAVVLPN